MRSLTVKLIIAFAAICLVEALLVAGFVRESTQRSFDRFVRQDRVQQFADQAAAFYELRGSWTGVEQWVGRSRVRRDRARTQRRPARMSRNEMALTNAAGIIIVPNSSHRIGDRLPQGALGNMVPVEVDGIVRGYVIPGANLLERGSLERQYLERTDNALMLALVFALAVAIVLGIVAARSYMRPIKELTDATQRLSAGQWGEQVPVRTKDELSTLTVAFNDLSANLANQMELRRQMTADIAHDLRTPLTVLKGYLEAIRDGDLEATPERIDTMHQEAKRLARLIEDLRMLSLADAGELSLRLQPCDVGNLLSSVRDRFSQQADESAVRIQTNVEPGLAQVQVDPDRMGQVLGNLVSNALRYTPVGGEIRLEASRVGQSIRIDVIDTGSGIPAAALPHVFERFYRVDESRHRATGESGLGLPIARSFVEAHGGTLTVQSEPDVGTRFSITLPRASRSSMAD